MLATSTTNVRHYAWFSKNYTRRLTQQHHEDRLNPAKIMARAASEQVLMSVRSNPEMMNAIDIPDRRSILDAYNNALLAMEDFPDNVKTTFRTPSDIINFLSREENREQAAKLGLLRSAPQKADPIRVVIDPPPA